MERTPEPTPVILDLAQLCALVQAELAPMLGADLRVSIGYPQQQGESRAEPARAPSAVVVLGLKSPVPPGDATLTLDAALATNLVDLALGGRGQLGIATTAALPSDAECGVLAYLAAKLSRHFDGVWIRDTYATAHPPRAPGVTWPISLRWSRGAGVAHLRWPLDTGATLQCQLGCYDQLSAGDLHALAVGDLLLSEALALSVTTRGLAGPCVMRMAGVGDVMHVLLDGNEVQARRAEPSAMHTQRAFIELSEAQVSCAQLAELVSGAWTAWSGSPPGRVRLLQDERLLAEGELVRFEAAQGVRIDAVG